MGATPVTVSIRNLAEPDQVWEGLFLVDTGATDCLVPRRYLETIGLALKDNGPTAWPTAGKSEWTSLPHR